MSRRGRGWHISGARRADDGGRSAARGGRGRHIYGVGQARAADLRRAADDGGRSAAHGRRGRHISDEGQTRAADLRRRRGADEGGRSAAWGQPAPSRCCTRPPHMASLGLAVTDCVGWSDGGRADGSRFVCSGTQSKVTPAFSEFALLGRRMCAAAAEAIPEAEWRALCAATI